MNNNNALPQPEFGNKMFAIRTNTEGDKKVSRLDFAKTVGLSPTQIRNIEFGRKMIQSEIDKIINVYPELLQDPSEPQSDQLNDDIIAFDPVTEGDEEPEQFTVLEPKYNSDIQETNTTQYTSNSEVQTFKRCRRKWYLAWYRGLRLKNIDITGPLATGSRVHNALRTWYVPSDQQPQDPRVALERIINDDWERYSSQFGIVSSDIQAKFKSTADLERAMVEGYMEWLSTTGADVGLSVVAPETTLSASLDIPGSDQPIVIVGKIDVRVIRQIDGVRLFIDHKTAASLTEPLKTIRLDEQMLMYHLLEWMNDIDNSRCDGALYNMLKKVKRTAKATPPFYDRVEVRHNEYEITAFKRRLIAVISDIVNVRRQLDSGVHPNDVAYPTPNKQCSWDCDFVQVCAMFDDGSRVEDMISHYYDSQDPFTYYHE